MNAKKIAFLCVILIGIAAALTVYLHYFHVDEGTKELLNSDVRIVYEEPEALAKAMKSDGPIYAYGEVKGAIDLTAVPYADLEFRKEDKAEKVAHVEELLAAEERDILLLNLISVKNQEEWVERGTGEYVDRFMTREEVMDYSYRLVSTPYANKVYAVDSFELLGQRLPLDPEQVDLNTLKWNIEETNVSGKNNEDVISYAIIPSGTSMWVEFEVQDGNVVPGSVVWQGIDNMFDIVATDAADKSNPLMLFLGILIFMAFLVGVVALIIRGFKRTFRI